MEAYCKSCEGMVNIDNASIIVSRARSQLIISTDRRAHEIIVGRAVKKVQRLQGNVVMLDQNDEPESEIETESEEQQ